MNNLPLVVYNTCDCDEPLTIPVALSLGAGEQTEVDLSNNWNLGKIKGIQTVFIDNSDSTGTITVTELITGHRIICPPKSQGYFPIFAGQGFKFNISSSAAAKIKIQFANFLVSAGVWSVQ